MLAYSHPLNKCATTLALYPGSFPCRKTGEEPGYEAITTHQQGTPHCSLSLLHIQCTCTCHVCHSQSQLSCSHPQHTPFSMHLNMHYIPSNTHSTAFHNPPMHTTKHSWQRYPPMRSTPTWSTSHKVNSREINFSCDQLNVLCKYMP